MPIREEKPISEIAQETGAHPDTASKRKKGFLDNVDMALS